MHDPTVLKPFTVLESTYLLGAPIGIGGFGITYAAKDLKAGNRLAIKEYFPQGIVRRDVSGSVCITEGYRQAFRHGLDRFSMEASVLQRLSNIPGIVRVDDFLEENGTGYIVMEFLPGRTLMKDAELIGGTYPFPRAAKVFRQTAAAMAKVHEAGLLHRDISPDNIMIDEVGDAKLIDFGAARAYMQQQELTVMMKRGYAPIEQYSSTASQGCYTDVYALGCTLYAVLTGRKVPEAPSRLENPSVLPVLDLRPDLPPSFAAAIEKAVEVLPQNRFQTMNEFLLAAEVQNTGKPYTGQPYTSKPYTGEPKPAVSGILRVISGRCAGVTARFAADCSWMVGRAAGEQRIRIPIETLSKEHFGVWYQPAKQRFIVWDNHSTNGTFFQSGERMIPGCQYAAFPRDTFYLSGKECMVQLDVQ